VYGRDAGPDSPSHVGKPIAPPTRRAGGRLTPLTARNLLLDLHESADRIKFLIRDRYILYPPELVRAGQAAR
jgi:hypothetical protein